MFRPKIKLDKELYRKLQKLAKLAGYASTEEFVTHILEREVAKMDDDSSSDEEVKKRLEGLGYIS